MPESTPQKQPHARASTARDDWVTPSHIIERARSVLGTIDLDPASSIAANTVVRATQFFSSGALDEAWHGRVWLNPPYGLTNNRKSISGLWLAKLLEEYRAGRTREAICLVNAMVGSEWFMNAYDHPLVLLFSRLRFLEPSTLQPQRNPTYGNALLYLGPHSKWATFGKAFADIGAVFVPSAQAVA